jgi:hypothetical protein
MSINNTNDPITRAIKFIAPTIPVEDAVAAFHKLMDNRDTIKDSGTLDLAAEDAETLFGNSDGFGSITNDLISKVIAGVSEPAKRVGFVQKYADAIFEAYPPEAIARAAKAFDIDNKESVSRDIFQRAVRYDQPDLAMAIIQVHDQRVAEGKERHGVTDIWQMNHVCRSAVLDAMISQSDKSLVALVDYIGVNQVKAWHGDDLRAFKSSGENYSYSAYDILERYQRASGESLQGVSRLEMGSTKEEIEKIEDALARAGQAGLLSLKGVGLDPDGALHQGELGVIAETLNTSVDKVRDMDATALLESLNSAIINGKPGASQGRQ